LNKPLISLKSYNTFGVESFASELIRIHSEKELIELDLKSRAGYKILGGGSNVLLTQDIQDTILKNEIKGIEIIEDHSSFTLVRVGAGETWHDVVLWALRNNLGGIENLSLIPGRTGAAPVQNIGAYGVELKDVLQNLQGIYLSSKKKMQFTNSECMFSYRNSIFKSELKEEFFICSIVLRLSKQHILHLKYGNIQEELEKSGISNPDIHDVSKAVIKIRSSKLPDPKFIGNAGSFFKNSIVTNENYQQLKDEYPNLPGYREDKDHMKIPSGWLIEQCGWKGKRIGDAGCYDKQALVLVNYGHAKGSDILRLASDIIDSVLQKFNIQLSPEVNIW
jgi:UDP-N-acetylmuramate dehydrogenase